MNRMSHVIIVFVRCSFSNISFKEKGSSKIKNFDAVYFNINEPLYSKTTVTTGPTKDGWGPGAPAEEALKCCEF